MDQGSATFGCPVCETETFSQSQSCPECGRTQEPVEQVSEHVASEESEASEEMELAASLTSATPGQPVIRPIQGPERRPQPVRRTGGPAIRPIHGPERRPHPVRRAGGPAIRPIHGPEREPLPQPPVTVPVTSTWTPPSRSAGSNSFLPWDTDDAPVVSSGRAGRKARPTVVAIATILLLMAGGLTGAWAVQRHLDSPIRDSFEAANSSFTQATEQLAAADSVEDLQAAATAYDQTLPLLDEAATQARTRDSEVAYAARRTVEDQVAVAEAATALSALTPEDISKWSKARKTLTTSVSALAERERDSGVLGVEAGTLPTPALVDHVHDVVGEAAAVTAGAKLERLFGDMTRARVTADLRQIGNKAELALIRMGPAVDLRKSEFATASLESPRQVDTYAQTLAALSAMTPLKPDALDQWGDMRAQLNQATDALGGDALDEQANAAAAAADTLVAKARASLARWQRAFDRAQDEKAKAIEGLGTYDEAMRPPIAQYGDLRESLSDLKQRVGAPGSRETRAEVSAALADAQAQRRSVRDTIAALSAPEGTGAAHRDLLQAINEDIAELGTASQQVANARVCRRGCSVRESLAWQRYAGASARINSALDSTLAAWQQALASAREAAQNAPLPKKPVV